MARPVPKPILDYAPPPTRRASLPAALAYAGFLTALLYLAYFHLAADAPLHSNGNPPLGLAQQRSLLKNTDDLIAAAAQGRSIQYHVDAPEEVWAANGKFFNTAYVSAVYRQYPARVLVGTDDAIINFATDLQKADQLPSEAWMHRHRVAAVFNLLPGDENGPRVLIHPIP